MTDYNGPATLVCDGAEYPVTAELRVESESVYGSEAGRETTVGVIRRWHGTLSSDNQQLAWAIKRVYDLRFPEGVTSRVYVPGGSYSTDQPPTGPVLLEITGTGPAPWIEDRRHDESDRP